MGDVAEKKKIANVLSNRYASAELTELWSPEAKIIMERQLWIAVMKAQKDLGVDIPVEAITAYENVINHVDLASIAERERVTRHDVKARIEEFNALAGYEHIHKGMTSAISRRMWSNCRCAVRWSWCAIKPWLWWRE